MFAWTRRHFLQVLGSSSLALAGTPSIGQQVISLAGETPPPWYPNAWRRAVIDMHIPDWDREFLSQFDARAYAETLVRSRAQSIVCYCQSHVGLFNYPTKVGKQHAAFQGRNVLQEMIDECHQRQIAVVLYCSLIYDRWCGDMHPEWRIRTWEGKIHGQDDRHAVMCINSPYRDYVRSFVEEICQNFRFEGIRFDMTFWPAVCYCQYCRERFNREVGGELPQTVDWLDEKWVSFQRSRERWLIDFAAIATRTVRASQRGASVEHQSSTYPLSWTYGVTEGLSLQNDFLQGDFYGDQLQGSFVRKLLERLSPNRPFAYETSCSVALADHTALKSEALLSAKAAAAIADNAAFVFIDAINPIGTVNERAHQRMGNVFDRLMPYYEHLGGERVEDVAIYYSLESKLNMQGNGRHISNADTSDSHTRSAMQVAARLIRGHIPFGVMTKRTIDQLDRFGCLVLANVHMMDDDECERIRHWVRSGGRLIATGGSSLVDKSGGKRPDFGLNDVLGVNLVQADWVDRPHYITPTPVGQAHFADFDRDYPALCQGYRFQVRAMDGAQVLATTTLPWPRQEPRQFASIHSEPPWVHTEAPEIVLNPYGKGAAVYCSSLIENMPPLEATFLSLLRHLQPDFRFDIDAPACVEATLFRQADRGRYTLTLLNFQDEQPNLPIEGIVCRVRIPNVQAVSQLPGGEPIPYDELQGRITFRVPRLETLAMFALTFG
jgi:hypothetical protein